MPSASLGPIAGDLVDETVRILRFAKEQALVLRLIGAAAYITHCPQFGYLQGKLGRALSDIDFAGRSAQSRKVRELFLNLGYQEQGMINMLFAKERLVFFDDANKRHTDVFFDKLSFNHEIHLADRLEISYPTIPLADLLLEKMQIVRINEKDLIDTMMLIREHKVGTEEDETINLSRIDSLCARDWGLWKTVTTNLRKVKDYAATCQGIGDSDRADVKMKIDELLGSIDSTPKSTRWNLRARIGEKKKWYNDVEELTR
jgi:hypothetical protein